MKRAHELARTGLSRFGGKYSDYFAESVRIAWAEHKALVTPYKRTNHNAPLFVLLVSFIALAALISLVFPEVLAVNLEGLAPDIPVNFAEVKNNFNNFKIKY